MGSAALEVDHATRFYSDGTRALAELSLNVPQGCFFGLLGPNGAGKTTLIRATAGLIRIGARSIYVFGHDVTSDPKARLLVGLAPQEIHLDRFLTTREVLSYHGGYFGMTKRESESRADELLEAFDLTSKARSKPNRLSGGMRRRLVIARALVHRPQLPLLDEATAGVDLELRYELWRYVTQLSQENTTVVLTTHYIEEAEALCDRVAFIRHGGIVADGSPAELLSRFGGARLEDLTVWHSHDDVDGYGSEPRDRRTHASRDETRHRAVDADDSAAGRNCNSLSDRLRVCSRRERTAR